MDPSVFRCIAWLYESRPTTGDSRMKPFVSASYAMTDQYCLAGTLGGTCSRYDRWPLAGDRFTVVVEEGDEVDDASALTHTLRESERSEVRQPPGIDVEVVAHDVAEIRLHAADIRKLPGPIGPPLLTERLHPLHEDGELLLGGVSEKADGGVVGGELLALFDADALESAHGEQVALGDRFVLHHAVEAFEEPLVESGDAVERLAVDVDEPLLRRVSRLREWIGADFFDQRQSSGDI